jgi:hypothetical protein
MNTFLSNDFIVNHLKSNFSNVDYQTYINNRMFDLDGLKLVANLNEILKSKSLIDKIELNVVLAKQRLNVKEGFRTPTTGDFVKVGDEYYRLVYCGSDSSFQYTINGSFFIGKEGYGTYSGGFNFEHGGTFKLSQLTPMPIDTKEGSFWFFSNDYMGGSRGVYMNGDFNVWEVIN